MSETVDIGREAVESWAADDIIPLDCADLLLALRDALDKAEKDATYWKERWDAANERLDKHGMDMFKLTQQVASQEATIARQQRAIERKDWALRMLKDQFPSDFDNMWKDALAYTGNGGEG